MTVIQFPPQERQRHKKLKPKKVDITILLHHLHTCQPPEYKNLEMYRNLYIVRMPFKAMSRNKPRKSPKRHSERPGVLMKNLETPGKTRRVGRYASSPPLSHGGHRKSTVAFHLCWFGAALLALHQLKLVSGRSIWMLQCQLILGLPHFCE